MSPISIKLQQDKLEVLKMQGPVLGFFQLVLGIPPEFAPHLINKWPGFPKIFPQKNLKVWSSDGVDTFALVAMLMLGLLIADGLIKKSCKQDIIGPYGLGRIKMIFALLTQVVAIQVWFFIV